jgi:hypothetical protein
MKSVAMRKPLAILLTVLMVFTLMPTIVFAGTSIDSSGIHSSHDGINASVPLAPGEVRTGKTVSKVGEGLFDIKLEAIGRKFEGPKVTEVPVQYDVVFVLDYSASMDDNGKKGSMVNAAIEAIDKILGNNSSTVFNRVAVVSYNDGAKTLFSTTNPWIQAKLTDKQKETLGDNKTASRTNIMSGMNQA